MVQYVCIHMHACICTYTYPHAQMHVTQRYEWNERRLSKQAFSVTILGDRRYVSRGHRCFSLRCGFEESVVLVVDIFIF